MFVINRWNNQRWTMQMIAQSRGGARGVMVIVVGNGHGNTCSNPGRG